MNSWNRTNDGMSVAPGSVLGVRRSIYDHYGILMNDGDVIHYTSRGSDISGSNEISRTSFERFLRGRDSFWTMRFPGKEEAALVLGERIDRIVAESAGRVAPAFASLLSLLGRETVVKKVLREYRLYNSQQTQERAIGRLGEQKYNAVSRNCEHFAFWCATGLAASQQVEAFLHGGVDLVSYLLSNKLFNAGFPGLSSTGHPGKLTPLFERSETTFVLGAGSYLSSVERREPADEKETDWNIGSIIGVLADCILRI